MFIEINFAIFTSNVSRGTLFFLFILTDISCFLSIKLIILYMFHVKLLETIFIIIKNLIKCIFERDAYLIYIATLKIVYFFMH